MTSFDFSGKTIVLTGVGRPGQVGEVVAKAFADSGAHVALIDRDDQVNARAEEITRSGGKASPYLCDLTNSDEVAGVAERIRADSGGAVAALVNLAGGFAMSGPVADSDIAVLSKQIAINLTTAYVATRTFLPLVRATRGAIVFFASAAVLPDGGVKNISGYAAAKAGVLALMRAVAAEELGVVRANAVAPTQIRTADNVAGMGDRAAYVEREAVADTVLFLCSDASRNITGQAVKLQ
ncbi:MAG TPA: SDR family oxidoreductase [Gemmatimonadaceae bacterium]|nr:SDR family oxidoreductase [Gemmatimonadaceae bacterium]